jgi:hypothetical protein
MAKGLKCLTEHCVNKIIWKKGDCDKITVSTNKGDFDADIVLVTVSLGILKSG